MDLGDPKLTTHGSNLNDCDVTPLLPVRFAPQLHGNRSTQGQIGKRSFLKYAVDGGVFDQQLTFGA